MPQETGRGPVQIRIDGLMIGRFSKDEPVCEISVMPAEGHRFLIHYELIRAEAVTRAVIDTGINNEQNELRRYSIEVEGAVPNCAPFLSPTVPDRHHPPGVSGSPEIEDFRWVLEVDGKEFPKHNGLLAHQAEKLRPIIVIKNGLFYNSLLSKPLIRQVGGKDEEFGVASDEMSVDIVPESGQAIVMKNIDSGKEIFRILLEEDEKLTILLENAPKEPPKGNVFHFHMYYNVFDKVPPSNRYNFIVKPDPFGGDAPPHGPADPVDHGGHHDVGHHGGNGPQPVALGSSDIGGGSAPLCGMVFVKD